MTLFHAVMEHSLKINFCNLNAKAYPDLNRFKLL